MQNVNYQMPMMNQQAPNMEFPMNIDQMGDQDIDAMMQALIMRKQQMQQEKMNNTP